MKDQGKAGHIPEVVIPREEAVFWMDGQGRWHNAHGPFQHKKIIAHFNACLGRDQGGYFVGQFRDGVFEKVYFRCQETALFVVDMLDGDPVQMVLNTGCRLALQPEKLFIHNDFLYYRNGDEIIKFSERTLTRLSEKIEHTAQGYLLRLQGSVHPLADTDTL
jgi:uncharacterized protein